MLKPALVAMTVMGCDCDARQCVPIEQPQARWASIEECEAALLGAVRSDDRIDYPLVTAPCHVLADDIAGTQLAVADPSETAAANTTAASPGMLGRLAAVGETGGYLVYRAGNGFVAVRQGLARAMDGTSGLASATAERAMAMLSQR